MHKNLNLEALGVSGRPSEIIELTLSYGFKGFDLDIVDFAEQVKTAGLAHARRLIDSARLKIGSFRLPTDFEVDAAEFKQELVALAGHAELAQQIGCTRAETTIAPANDERPFHENFELYRRRYAEAAEVLARYGIALGVGFSAASKASQGRTFQFVQAVDSFMLLVKSVSAKNFGVALDAWHWQLGGGTLDQIQGLGADKIITVSLADADADITSATADETKRRLPGETGVIDSAALLTVLSALKYTGPVTPKPSKEIFAGQSRDKIVKQAGAALDNVWKAAGLGVRPGVVSRA